MTVTVTVTVAVAVAVAVAVNVTVAVAVAVVVAVNVTVAVTKAATVAVTVTVEDHRQDLTLRECYRPRVRCTTLAAIAVVVAARPAAADELVLARGELVARLALEIDLAMRREGEQFAIAPDAWYGVTPRWTVGVIHSNTAVDRIAGDASLCVRGCDRVYRGGGLDARWSWLRGPLSVAPRARLLVRDVDPWKPAATIGALARWTRGRFSITGDPYLRLGLANRGLGNRAALAIPLWFAISPARCWRVAIRTGWDGELATLGDGWHVPFALAAAAQMTSQVEISVEAGFPSLLGPQNDFKQRAMAIAASYRW